MTTIIDGFILLDKPLTMTSNRALQQVKKLLNAKKAGHTGTLDPLATGMLPLCLGRATRFSQFLLNAKKHYWVKGQLGIKTTTADAEGDVLEERPVPENWTEEKMEEHLKKFRGEIMQTPSMFSAIKHKGQPLYKLARKGIEVEREPRKVYIERLTLLSLTETTFELDVVCSKGTYIRNLVEDLGEAIGCGAHVTGLRRLSVVPFKTGEMVTFDKLEEAVEKNDLTGCLLPIESALTHLEHYQLTSLDLQSIRKEKSISVRAVPGFVRLLGEGGALIGVGEISEGGRLRLIRKLS